MSAISRCLFDAFFSLYLFGVTTTKGGCESKVHNIMCALDFHPNWVVLPVNVINMSDRKWNHLTYFLCSYPLCFKCSLTFDSSKSKKMTSPSSCWSLLFIIWQAFIRPLFFIGHFQVIWIIVVHAINMLLNWQYFKFVIKFRLLTWIKRHEYKNI